MELADLRIENLRVFEQAAIALEPGWNVFIGANGSGKTTILEAAYLLSHGRSFRTYARDVLVRRSAPAFAVSALVCPTATANAVRTGLVFDQRRLQAQMGGAPVASAELMRQVAVTCFEPGSHELIAGVAEGRRRFMDWGVFHVEHAFIETWRRYQRALRQRNAALRGDCVDAELDAWDLELVTFAEALIEMRARYIAYLRPFVIQALAGLVGELGAAALQLASGTPRSSSLADVLRQRRVRDRALGYTSVGPHRADWSIAFDKAPGHRYLSRGQTKLVAFACVIGQAAHIANAFGEYPVICLDDLASELDAAHLEKVIGHVASMEAQFLVTGTDGGFVGNGVGRQLTTFHVEQGWVQKML